MNRACLAALVSKLGAYQNADSASFKTRATVISSFIHNYFFISKISNALKICLKHLKMPFFALKPLI